VARVVVEQLERDLVECGLDRGGLGQDVDAERSWSTIRSTPPT
jgi:hypothetical protein